MKIRVERDELADAVAWVARSLPSRPPVPVLGGILLGTGGPRPVDGESGSPESGSSGDALRISGFDYEVSAQMDVAATVATEGTVLVSGRLLADITKALPPHPVELSVEGSRVDISCGNAHFSLPTMPAEDYPNLPAMPAAIGSVAAESFATAVGQVAVASIRDDTLPMLTGVRVEFDGPRMTMIATDRFRLAMRTMDWQPAAEADPQPVLIPARTLNEAAKSLAGGGTPIELALADGEGLMGLHGGRRRATTRLLDSEFPPVRQLLPTEQTTTATVEVATLVDAIKRVSLVAERGTQVRLRFAEGTLELSAGGSDEGSAEEAVESELAGEEVTIAFNPGYLLDGLAAVRSERAQFSFTDAARPALIKPVTEDGSVSEDYLYLLMPVRLPG